VLQKGTEGSNPSLTVSIVEPLNEGKVKARAAIRQVWYVYDETGNMIETHKQTDEFKEW
jgi:hypothetical protein